MIDNFDNIKEYVLALGGFEESNKLDLQIQVIINEVLAYCYREDIPKCMELPLANAIVNELSKSGFTASIIGFSGNITSYKEGDMQITLGCSEATSSNGGVLKYGGKLERFKKIIGAIECSETTDAQ